MLPYILTIILIVGLVLFFKSAKFKGMVGEFRVKLALGRTKEGVKYIINDLMIVDENGKSSQLDHIAINKNGIFVIETKNYSGRIFGKDSDQQWTQVLNYGKVKNKFYNPVKQNKTHLYKLKEVIGQDYYVESIICFVKANIKYINSQYVYSIRGMKKELKKERMKELSVDEMQEIFDKLIEIKNNKQVSNREHVKEIKQMKKDIANNICPRCGGNLVLRKSANGEFYGCENFPKCKFIKKQ